VPFAQGAPIQRQGSKNGGKGRSGENQGKKEIKVRKEDFIDIREGETRQAVLHSRERWNPRRTRGGGTVTVLPRKEYNTHKSGSPPVGIMAYANYQLNIEKRNQPSNDET